MSVTPILSEQQYKTAAEIGQKIDLNKRLTTTFPIIDLSSNPTLESEFSVLRNKIFKYCSDQSDEISVKETVLEELIKRIQTECSDYIENLTKNSLNVNAKTLRLTKCACFYVSKHTVSNISQIFFYDGIYGNELTTTEVRHTLKTIDSIGTDLYQSAYAPYAVLNTSQEGGVKGVNLKAYILFANNTRVKVMRNYSGGTVEQLGRVKDEYWIRPGDIQNKYLNDTLMIVDGPCYIIPANHYIESIILRNFN